MKKIGLIINPIAGLGGPAGMKGTDRALCLERAKELGIEPQAPARVLQVLSHISRTKHADFELVCAPGSMGADVAGQAGYSCTVCGELADKETTPADTVRIACQMEKEGVDLLVFGGGDGTARDVCSAVGDRILVLGVPCGVKMHSAVFAVNPAAAAQTILAVLSEKSMADSLQEVMDLDEQAYVDGILSAKLYGYMRVPYFRKLIQGTKGGSSVPGDMLQGLAEDVCEDMERNPDTLYLIGAGTTTMAIKEMLKIEGTLLGVDVVKGGQLIAKDVSAPELLKLTEGSKAKIVISPIGGQGFIFGRGNQQFSAPLIERVGKANIIVVCPVDKITALNSAPLLVDTGSETTNALLCGYIKLTTNYQSYTMYRVSDGING